MSLIHVQEVPGPALDTQMGAIRQVATGYGLALPVARRLNWLLAARGCVIGQYRWPSTVTSISSRIYHNASTNCARVGVIAIIERASAATGTISFTPSGGSAETSDHESTAATTRWGAPSWEAWYHDAPITASGVQYHTISWTDLIVRSLTVFEIPRDWLDTASDTMVDRRGSGYAGLEAHRLISEGTSAGINDLIAATASARDATTRHGPGIIIPDGSAWSLTSSGAWANIADTALGTSDFGFAHRARYIRAATTSVAYTARIRARYQGTGTGDFRLVSGQTSDSISFTSLTSSWAWYSPDASATLDIDCQDDDEITPEAQTTDGTTTVEVSSIQIFE